MNNLTEMYIQNETQETLKSLAHLLGSIDKSEPNIDLTSSDYRWSRLNEISEKYDLPKFFKSLTDEELTWRKDVQISGKIESDFHDTPPEEIWDDEDALEEYMSNLFGDEVEDVHLDIVDTNLEISYRPNLVISSQVVAKLEDTKLQMKKYQVEGVFDKTIPNQSFRVCVDATSFENAESKVEAQLNDENVYVSRVIIRDVSAVA